jgi:LmbE family N-acetylglucosaminyl deacetylase
MPRIGIVLLLATTTHSFAQTPEPPIEQWRGKKILVFSPHPDDDTWGCGGTLALLAKSGNEIKVVVYTNDDKGSFDLTMTSERLARIRKTEEEASIEALGLPKSSLMWMGYHDGELEYANPRDLVERTTAVIREFRPDVLLSVDPGEWYSRWHKSDHRMAANNTIDAVRAAEFHLYFPNQFLAGLKPYRVPLLLFYYSIPQEENYFVNIDAVIEQKIESYSRQVSQFEPSIDKYRPDWKPEDLAKFREAIRARHFKKDGHYVEAFRKATGFNQK